MEEARRGGGEKARKRHEERGKLLVRDRIDRPLDPDTAFLELWPLAPFRMYDGELAAVGEGEDKRDRRGDQRDQSPDHRPQPPA